MNDYLDLLGIAREVKFTPELEQNFREDFFRRNITYRRRSLCAIFIIALVFGLNQYDPDPSKTALLLKIHYLIYCPILAVVVFAGFKTHSSRWSQMNVMSGLLITGFIYIVMEYITPTPPGSEASQTTVVLIMVIVAACTSLRLLFPYAMFCTWVLFTAYAVNIAIFPMPNWAWNIGAMLMACTISSLGSWTMDLSVRNIFLSHWVSENLLHSILPPSIASRLSLGERVIADHLENVTVLFADIKGFTQLASKISPTELVKFLNRVFSAFDRLVEKNNLEKIKTIGDAYMVVGGLNNQHGDNSEAIANLAIEMLNEIQNIERPDSERLHMRIGIHTGSVVAGVIGEHKFSYDVWGDTVNLASRMESLGEVDKIQVTVDIYERLKEKYEFDLRGLISVGEREYTTYWLIKQKQPVPGYL